MSLYRVSHDLRSLLRESVPYVKIYRHNPKHLCPKLNGYGDNGKRKVWTSWGCTHYTCQLAVIYVRPCVGCHVNEFLLTVARSQELLRQWPGVYGDNERIAFNIPSWNTTTYVTCSDFDCVIVFVNFLLHYTVKCVFFMVFDYSKQ